MHRISLLLSAFVLVVALAIAPVTPTSARGVEWCWDDPVVTIDGRTVQIDVGVMGEPDTVRRNVKVAHVWIYTPQGVSTKLLAATHTYFREVVHFVPSNDVRRRGNGRGAAAWQPGQPVPVLVVVEFEARTEMLAGMRVNHPHGTLIDEGTTRGRLSAGFVLP